MTTTTDPDETSTYLYETTVGLRRRGTVERQQRALCVQREDSAAKVTVTYMGETGLGTQLNIDIPADEIPAMAKALIAAAGLPDPFAMVERVRALHVKRDVFEVDEHGVLGRWLSSGCEACSDPDLIADLEDGALTEDLAPWPCDTIRVLDKLEVTV